MILGNPPYNGFAGMAIDEERELSTAYRTTRRVRRPEGQGLNDLYVRFFRMAERRIAGKTKRGIVCFISNYSWLDGLSFTGMRERYLEAFDKIRIDNLHGDRIISEYAPDGRTSETVMAIRGQSPGIKVGTAIALLSKSGKCVEPTDKRIIYRDFHEARADERRHALLRSLDSPSIDAGYSPLKPNLGLGLPFKPMAASEGWQTWPSVADLFPVSFPGVKTSRDSFLVDVDQNRLRGRVTEYFDSDIRHEEIAQNHPTVMKSTRIFDAGKGRYALLSRGGPIESGFVRHAYRPFDSRWLYWEDSSGLLDRPRPEYKPHVFEGNLWLVTQQKPRRDWSPPQVISHLGCLDLMDRGATCISAYLRDDGLIADMDGGTQLHPNLSPAAHSYLDRLGMDVEDLFHHVLAVLHDPAYREANAGALRMEWPRIPLPGWPNGDDEVAAAKLAVSAARGRKLAALLDPDTPVPGVTEGRPRPELAKIAVASTTDDTNMAGDDFALTAGWGHLGQGEAVMPGQGRPTERPYTTPEQTALANAAQVPQGTFGLSLSKASAHEHNDDMDQPPEGTLPEPACPELVEGSKASAHQHNPDADQSPESDPTPILGDTTFDIYLNNRAYWRNVPSAVWNYKLGGYQVLKKWLSYREHKVLHRPLNKDEVQHFTNTARRITAILELTG